jgi:hypothetical protein
MRLSSSGFMVQPRRSGCLYPLTQVRWSLRTWATASLHLAIRHYPCGLSLASFSSSHTEATETSPMDGGDEDTQRYFLSAYCYVTMVYVNLLVNILPLGIEWLVWNTGKCAERESITAWGACEWDNPSELLSVALKIDLGLPCLWQTCSFSTWPFGSSSDITRRQQSMSNVEEKNMKGLSPFHKPAGKL